MNSVFDKPFTFDRVMRIVFSVVMIAGIIYLITILRNALLPFLIAWLLAYMMQPFVKFFQYKLRLKSRILSILAVLLSTLVLVSLLVGMVLPSLATEADKTLQLLRMYSPADGYIPFVPESWLVYLHEHVDLQEWMDLLSRENVLKAVKQLAPRVCC